MATVSEHTGASGLQVSALTTFTKNVMLTRSVEVRAAKESFMAMSFGGKSKIMSVRNAFLKQKSARMRKVR